MRVEQPGSPAELAEQMRDCQERQERVEIAGSRSKVRMGGPVADAAVRIETKALHRVLAYDPRDLTISVEAGILCRDLMGILAEKKQFLPIEAPFAETATIGGVLATHSSGHRRRLFGTVRDLVIGMTFATLEGKIVQSGGMVVKNVAGLDFAKLMTGSFGTLACIASVNFKLMPAPVGARTFLLEAPGAAELTKQRHLLLGSILQPAAVDVVSPAAAKRLGLSEGWALVVEALGSERVLDRYQRELPGFRLIDNGIWDKIREFTPEWLEEHRQGCVVRLTVPLTEIEKSMPEGAVAIARGGNGVVYLYSAGEARTAQGVVEFSPELRAGKDVLWPRPGNDFFLMEKIKRQFDPQNLLNAGRLYGRI